MLLAALPLFLPTTIDYSTVAKPLPVVLRELGSITGEEWRATKALEGELLVVRVEDVTKDDLRKHVADAIVGKWYQDDAGAWVLRPDEAKLRKRADARRRNFSEQIQKQVTEFCDDLWDLPQVSDEELAEAAADGFNGGSDVAQFLLAHALRQLNCYEAVGFPEGDQIVFSTANNRLQRPLRLGRSILDQALRMQHRFADASAKADVEEPEVGTYEHERRQREIAKWRGPLRIVLIVEYWYDELRFRCLVMDGSNNVAERASLSFALELEPSVKLPDKIESTTPDYSPDTVLFERFGSFGSAVPRLEDFDSKFLAKIRKPTLHDPLSFTVTEYLTEIGRRAEWNIVARPFDEVYYGDGNEEPSSLSGWLEYIQWLTSIHVEQKDGWLIVGPSGFRPQPQVDRKAMEDFIAQGLDRIPTLDEAANYALVSADNLIELNYLSPFVGFNPDWTWLRFYGTLPADLRKRLWSQEPVHFGALPPKAHNYLQKLILNDDSYRDDEYWYNEEIYDSPHITDLLPNGVLDDTLIRSKATQGYCLLQTNPRHFRARSVTRSFDYIAETAARNQFFDATESAQFPWSLAPFIVGSVRELDISIKIGPFTLGDTLEDSNISRHGSPITGAPLPEAMQKSFDEAAARHLKRMIEEGGGRQ